MKKLILLSFITCGAHAACDTGYVEIEDTSVIMATTDVSCPAGWVEITDSSILPANGQANSDSKGGFTYGSCAVQ